MWHCAGAVQTQYPVCAAHHCYYGVARCEAADRLAQYCCRVNSSLRVGSRSLLARVHSAGAHALRTARCPCTASADMWRQRRPRLAPGEHRRICTCLHPCGTSALLLFHATSCFRGSCAHRARPGPKRMLPVGGVLLCVRAVQQTIEPEQDQPAASLSMARGEGFACLGCNCDALHWMHTEKPSRKWSATWGLPGLS